MKKDKKVKKVIKMKIVAAFLLAIIILIEPSLVAQSSTNIFGVYAFKTDSYQENIELKSDGNFVYKVSMEFINLKIYGYWHLQNDSIVLNSIPTKENIIVWESRKKKKGFRVFVSDKERHPISYSIVAKLENGDTLHLTNQWKSSKFKKTIKSFFIVSTMGLTSQEYTIKGSTTNSFDVLFETSRVLNNEKWKYDGFQVTPKGFNGLERDFKLTRL
jgi:hypothetical protein